MNKKAQSGPIGFIFMVIVFLILWFVWIGEWLAQVGETAITEQGLTGFVGFVFGNLNMFVFIGLILGILGFTYWWSGE